MIYRQTALHICSTRNEPDVLCMMRTYSVSVIMKINDACEYKLNNFFRIQEMWFDPLFSLSAFQSRAQHNAELPSVIILLRRIAMQSIRRCVLLLQMQRGLTVCVYVGHNPEPCRNGWTDRDAVWVVDAGAGPRVGPGFTQGKGQFWRLFPHRKCIAENGYTN